MARGNTGVARALCLALLCVLPGSSLSGSAQNEPIIFFGDHNFPPYEFLDAGTPRGASVDLLNAIGEVLERPIEIRLMKWSEAQDKVLGGGAHALTLMSKNEKRLALYDFSDGTFNITFSLFVKAEMVTAFDAVGLDGRRIGVVKAGFPQAFLEEHHPEAELVFVDTLLDGFNKLLLGQLDAVGSATWVGYHALSENDISGIQALPRPFSVKIAGISVPKGNEALVREINRALAEIKRSGRFAQILGKWSRHEVVLLERKEIWVFVAIATLASIALASFVVLLWVVQSRRITRNRAAEVQAANTMLREEIAERKQVEDALRESEEHLSLAVESANIGTWIRTVPDDMVILDERSEAIFGLEPGTFEGTFDAYLARVHPDDHERIKAGHEQLINDGVRYEIDYRAILPDGSTRHVATQASLIRNDRDSTVQIIGMLHDITERKHVEEVLKNAHDELESRVEDRTAELRETNERLIREIAQRERTAKALRESQEQLKGIADNLPGAVYRRVLHTDGTISYPFMSDGFHRMHGTDPEKAHADSQYLFDSVHPEDIDRVLKEVNASAETMGTYDCEYRLIGEGGSITWCRSIAQPRRTGNGDIIWDGVTVDITERKSAEAALRESETSLTNAQRIAHFGNWDWDIVTGDLHWSDEIYRIFGLQPQQFGATYETFLQTIHPNDREAVQVAVERALEEREPYAIDHRIVLPDGEERIVHEQGEVAFDEAGNPVRMTGTVQDVTERKRAEAALRESEERYARAVAGTNDGLWDWNIQTNEDYFSPRWEEIVGHEPGDLEPVMQSFMDLIHRDDSDRVAAAVRDHLDNRVPYDIEIRLRHKNGGYVWVRSRGQAVWGENDTPLRMAGSITDITEQKRAEAEIHKLNEELEQRVEARTAELRRANRALGQSEERFRTMVEQAGDAMFLTEPDGSFIDVNQRACDALGYTRAELLALSVPEIDPIFSKEKFHELFEGLQLHAPVTVEAVHRRKDGTTYPVEIRTGRIELHGRKLLLAFARDISQRKRAEDALRESEERLSLAIQSANFGTWSRNIPGDRVIWDERTEAIFGLEPGAFEGTMEAFLAQVHPDDREGITTGHRRLMEEGVPYAVDFRITWPSGEVRHIATRASVVRGDRDSSLQIIGMLHDITERKHTEEALRESEEQLRLITDNVPAVIAYVDANQRYRFINKRYEEWFGISPEEAYGRRISDVVGEAAYDTVKENLAKALSGERVAFETSLPIKNAGIRHVQATYVPHLSDDGGVRGVFVLVTDITERKRLEEELLRRERLATLGQLTATVSHELRNPLGVIRTSAFILRDGLKEETPRAIRALDRIERSVLRCDRIIDEMLDFTRISDLEPEPTALDDWLAGVIEEQPLPTGISLHRELRLPGLTVALDRDRFRRAVINVFDNACQAMRGEGDAETEPSERVLTVRTRERDGRIEVLIEDRGVGIAPDVYKRIFEPLFSTKGFGVGLGLPVVKQIMEQHGGGIEIETEEGRGTTVCLWLDRNARAKGVAA